MKLREPYGNPWEPMEGGLMIWEPGGGVLRSLGEAYEVLAEALFLGPPCKGTPSKFS